ncbi:unnamed protein product, partial [Musa acuminata subsp. burmannicoides]
WGFQSLYETTGQGCLEQTPDSARRIFVRVPLKTENQDIGHTVD